MLCVVLNCVLCEEVKSGFLRFSGAEIETSAPLQVRVLD